MLIQSVDELERQVAVAEIELAAIEAAHHLDSAKFIELEDLAGRIDGALALVSADAGGLETAGRLRQLRGRLGAVLGRVVRVLH